MPARRCYRGRAAEAKKKPFRNDRVLGVPSVSQLFSDLQSPKDLGEPTLRNVTGFWVNYDALRGVTFKVLGVKGPQAAFAAVRAAQKKSRR